VHFNPPANLDLIEYNLETGETKKYITTEHVFECSYARSMASTTDGNFLIITNSPDNSISIIDLTLSNIEKKKSLYNISLFPNPSKSYLQVSIKGIIDNNYKVEIYNWIGQKMKYNQKSKQKMNFKIDISEFPKGQYFMRLYNSDFSSTSKFQKM